MLIIIDMIDDFAKKGGVLYVPGVERIIATINERINWHIAKGNIIIMVTDNHKPNSHEFKRFPEHAVQHTKGANIIKALDTEVLFDKYWRLNKYFHVGKDSHNGFFDTELQDILEDNYRPYKPRPVEVAGVCTSICVMDTVGWLAAMGYAITIREKCVADLTTEDHNYALDRMEKLYGVEIIRRA